MSAHDDAPTSTGEALPPPPPPPTPIAAPARAGELTDSWRIVTACLWVGMIGAFAAIWNTSVQLGLSTWWLGPRGDPQPQVVRLLPFVAPVLMLLATFANTRWLGRLGIGAAAVTAVFGLGDLARVPELAVVELVVAGLAALVSAASSTGTYRARPADPEPPTEPPTGPAG